MWTAKARASNQSNKILLPCSYDGCDKMLLRNMYRMDEQNYCAYHRNIVKRERALELKEINKDRDRERNRARKLAARRAANIAKSGVIRPNPNDHLTLVYCPDDSWPTGVWLERHQWILMVKEGDLNGAVWRDQGERLWTAAGEKIYYLENPSRRFIYSAPVLEKPIQEYSHAAF